MDNIIRYLKRANIWQLKMIEIFVKNFLGIEEEPEG